MGELKDPHKVDLNRFNIGTERIEGAFCKKPVRVSLKRARNYATVVTVTSEDVIPVYGTFLEDWPTTLQLQKKAYREFIFTAFYGNPRSNCWDEVVSLSLELFDRLIGVAPSIELQRYTVSVDHLSLINVDNRWVTEIVLARMNRVAPVIDSLGISHRSSDIEHLQWLLILEQVVVVKVLDPQGSQIIAFVTPGERSYYLRKFGSHPIPLPTCRVDPELVTTISNLYRELASVIH
jgi:hypothetical protein